MPHFIQHNKTLLLIEQLLPREISKIKATFSYKGAQTEKEMLKAFNYLLNHIMSQNKETLSKEALFKAVFESLEYDDVRLRHLLSKINKCILDYWATAEYEKHPAQYALNLGSQLLQRNLYEEYDRQHAISLEKLEKTPHAHAEFHLYLFQLEFQELESTTTVARKRSPGKIESILKKLDIYYLIKKLQLCCELLNMQNMMATEPNILLFDEIMIYAEQNKAHLPVAGKVYYYIINMLRYPEQRDNYHTLKETLVMQSSLFPDKELRELYHYALNYCIKQINLGDLLFQQELLNTYMLMLEKKLLHIGRHIPEHNFKNVVTVALREQQLEWAHFFIHEYIQEVSPDSRHNAFHYNIANYYFSLKDYKQALLHLQKVHFNDPYYALDSRCMLMKIYFEMDEDQVLDSHISAFRVFLHRSKTISDFQRTIYKNLVNFTSRLMHASHNTKRIKTLKKSIEQTKQIADLRWLNEKIDKKLKTRLS